MLVTTWESSLLEERRLTPDLNRKFGSNSKMSLQGMAKGQALLPPVGGSHFWGKAGSTGPVVAIGCIRLWHLLVLAFWKLGVFVWWGGFSWHHMLFALQILVIFTSKLVCVLLVNDCRSRRRKVNVQRHKSFSRRRRRNWSISPNSLRLCEKRITCYGHN